MLFNDDVVKSCSEHFWETSPGPVNWQETYQMQQCVLLERKIRDFRWKVINKCLTTEAKLKHFTESNGICKLCELETEDEKHTLIDCISLEYFWSTIIIALKKVTDQDQ